MGAWVKQQCLLPVDTRAVFLEGLVGIWRMDCCVVLPESPGLVALHVFPVAVEFLQA